MGFFDRDRDDRLKPTPSGSRDRSGNQLIGSIDADGNAYVQHGFSGPKYKAGKMTPTQLASEIEFKRRGK